MAKKKVKTKARSSSSSLHPHHEKNARAVLSLVILLLAFGILIVFYNNKDNIIMGGNFQQFMYLAGLALVFLVALLYLVNPHKRK